MGTGNVGRSYMVERVGLRDGLDCVGLAKDGEIVDGYYIPFDISGNIVLDARC